MSKHDYLQGELDGLIERFDAESNGHKRMYRRCRYAIFLLTACSTVLASLSLNLPDLQSQFSLAIVIISATVGAVTSFEGLRKPAELWVHERAILYSLKDIKRELEFQTAEQEGRVSLDAFFDRVQSVLKGAGDKWQQQIVGDRPGAPGTGGTAG